MTTNEIKHKPWPKNFEPATIGLEKDAKRYVMGECSIFLGTLPNGKTHMSISHATRLPTWDEVSKARYKIIDDDKDMAMYLPKKDDYVNVHIYCLHLFECTCYGGD